MEEKNSAGSHLLCRMATPSRISNRTGRMAADMVSTGRKPGRPDALGVGLSGDVDSGQVAFGGVVVGARIIVPENLIAKG